MNTDIINYALKELYKVQFNFTKACFREIFHEKIADHLWNRFSGHGAYNLLELYHLLDANNKARLASYIGNKIKFVQNEE